MKILGPFFIILFALLIPIAINYILQIYVTDSVIGTPATWLSFWGSYLAAIISAVMVYFSYKTIKIGIETTTIQRKLQWHDNFRNAIYQLRNATDMVRITELQQDLHDRKFSYAKAELYNVQRKINEAANNLDYLFIDRDFLYGTNERNRLTKSINVEIKPVLEYILALSQYASMQDGLNNKSYGNLSYTEILDLQNSPLSEIINDNPYKPMSIQPHSLDLLMAIAGKYGSWDYNRLDSLLRGIYKMDSMKAMES